MARSILAKGVFEQAMDVTALYDAHADFVWRSLHRLGVRSADLPDLLQEVFVVLHRRRAELDATTSARGLLWTLALGLAQNYRRKS
ncbi:MAG: sigma-70 family RNA polymerase sigma factor, partial [Deltaproteobacteria bacterium]|nr:sigma-70 family RNA polymerase sigma factor [Deltaproteobacteria bacterium]